MAVGDAETENGSTQLGQCNESLSLRREPGELPRGVTDDEPAILEPGKDEQVESVAGCDSTKCLCLCDGKGLRDARASRTDLEMQELAELSRGMIDEHNALTESTILEPGMIDEHNALNESTILDPEIVEQVELSPDVTSSNACAYVTEKEAEMQELAELPQGMTDEHNALNESKEIEEVGE
ncbi:hypothetical protein ACFX2C_000777 [Malus domestica]